MGAVAVPDNKKEPTKWVQVILKLTELTQAGEVDWTIDRTAPRRRGEDFRDGVAFRTEYRDWILRLLKYDILFKPTSMYGPGGFVGSDGSVMFRSTFSVTTFMQHEEQPFWSSRFRLAIITADGEELYQVPETDGLPGLYSAVQYRVANAGGFLKDFLSEAED